MNVESCGINYTLAQFSSASGRRARRAATDERVVCLAPTRQRSGRGARGATGARGGRGARREGRGPARGRGEAAARGRRALTPPWRRLSTHTTRADIMIWRQSEYTHTLTHTHSIYTS